MRVVIADDTVLVRRGIASLLTDEGVQIVGEAANATELHEAVLRTLPDIAIIDIRMPPTHSDEGVRAAERIRRECPNVGILLLSQYVDINLAVRLLEGREVSTGYLLKDRVATVSELISALDRIHEGGTVVEPTLVASLVNRRNENPQVATFTGRERDVLALIAEGRTDRANSGSALSLSKDHRGPHHSDLPQARPRQHPRSQQTSARCSVVPTRVMVI